MVITQEILDELNNNEFIRVSVISIDYQCVMRDLSVIIRVLSLTYSFLKIYEF